MVCCQCVKRVRNNWTRRKRRLDTKSDDDLVSVSLPASPRESDTVSKATDADVRGSPKTRMRPSLSLRSEERTPKRKILESGCSPFACSSKASLEMLCMNATQFISGLEGNEQRFVAALEAIEEQSNWTAVPPSRRAKFKASYFHTPGTNWAYVWMAIELDHNLVQSMSLGNELDLWPKWNKVVTLNEFLEPPTSPYRIYNRWLRSLAMGLYKTDTLNDLQRYINHDQCYYLEHVQPIGEDHRLYEPPKKGYYREAMESSLMLLPITGGRTLWLSCTKAEFPISLGAWLARQIIPTVAREIATSVINGVNVVAHPEHGKPWMERISAEKTGLYAELATIANTEHSYDISNLPPPGTFPVPRSSELGTATTSGKTSTLNADTFLRAVVDPASFVGE